MLDPKLTKNKQLMERLFGEPTPMSEPDQVAFREKYGVPQEAVYDSRLDAFGIPDSNFVIAPNVIADKGSWAAAYGTIVLFDQESAD